MLRTMAWLIRSRSRFWVSERSILRKSRDEQRLEPTPGRGVDLHASRRLSSGEGNRRLPVLNEVIDETPPLPFQA
jgi:hypothetical protein